MESKLEAAIAGAEQQTLFANDEERTTARDVLRVIANAPRALRSADLSRPEVQREIVERLQQDATVRQGMLGSADLAAVVRKTAELVTRLTIDIPRIVVTPKGDGDAHYRDFDLDTSRWPRYAAVAKDILIQHLSKDQERYRMVSAEGPARVKRMEDHLVFLLMDYDEIDYDRNADLLYKLSGQAVAHLRGYLAEADVGNVLQYHRQAMVQLIHGQMEEHFEAGAVEYEAEVRPGYTTIQPQLVAIDADEQARDYRLEVQDKAQIGGLLFGGFAKCLQTRCKFQSDPERVFAAVLEQDGEVTKWFRPALRDIRIYYRLGSAERPYQPDFLVETAARGKWICETKRANQMDDEEVRAKAAAGARWCKDATEATGESWGYLLVPHDQVRLSMTFGGFVAGCRV